MPNLDPFDFQSLAKQITSQKKMDPKLDQDIDWSQPIDRSKTFLPLTELEELFPDASMEQYIALSQWLGLVVNHTISEFEETLFELKQVAWQSVLEEFPVSSEMNELGEMFFALRAKHSRDFDQYQKIFCQTQGIDQDILESLMPKCYGTFFQSTITSNAIAGGPMLWWVLAEVEEASVDVCQNILDNWDLVDPLFCDIHRKHVKENAL